MRSTFEMLHDLVRDIRELTRVEFALARAEINERASQVPASLAAVGVGIALVLLALGLVLAAASLFLTRFELPLDLAFLVVGVGAAGFGLLMLRLGAGGLNPLRFVPAKSFSQIRSLFGGL